MCGCVAGWSFNEMKCGCIPRPIEVRFKIQILCARSGIGSDSDSEHLGREVLGIPMAIQPRAKGMRPVILLPGAH